MKGHGWNVHHDLENAMYYHNYHKKSKGNYIVCKMVLIVSKAIKIFVNIIPRFVFVFL